jgi:hypothetical protein
MLGRSPGRHPGRAEGLDDITAYYVAAGDTDLTGIADNEGTRGGQIAQRGERVFGLVLL